MSTICLDHTTTWLCGYMPKSWGVAQDSTNDAIAGSVTGWIYLVFNIGALFGGPIFAFLIPSGFRTAGLGTLGLSSLLSLILTLFTRSVVHSNIAIPE